MTDERNDGSSTPRSEGDPKVLQDKYDHILHNAPYGIYEVDFDRQKLVKWNQAMLDFTGYTQKDMTYLSPVDFLEAESAVKFFERLIKLKAGEEVDPVVEYQVKKKDGSLVWVELDPKYLYENGNLKGAQVIIREITEKKKTQEILRSTEEQYRSVVENAMEAILILKGSEIVFMNRITTELTGYSMEEMISRPFLDFVHDDDKEEAVERYLRRISGEEIPNKNILRIISKDEAIHWAEIKSILIDWEGEPATLNFVSDITDRKQAEDELNYQKENAEFYLDLLSHDIGNIMQGLSAWIEIGKRDPSDPRKCMLSLEHAGQLSDRTKRLVRNVLIISRMREKDPKLVPIDLISSLQKTVEEIERLYPEKNISVDIDGEGKIEVLAEPLLDEIFFNIMQNAVKFQIERDPKLDIIIKELDETLKVHIKDHGPGIPDELKPLIFSRFRDKTGKKFSGIGLALSKELSDRFGGSIAVEDNVEDGDVVGADFIIELKKA